MKKIGEMLYCFVKNHPLLSYIIVALPACTLMATGAFAIAAGDCEEEKGE